MQTGSLSFVDVRILKVAMTSQFPDMTSLSSFYDVFLVFLTSLAIVVSLMSVLLLGSGVMTFLFCKGLTRNSEIRNTLIWGLSNTCRLGKSRLPNLAGMLLIKCYWMLQNVRVKAVTVSELLSVTQQGEMGGKVTPHQYWG